MAPWLPSARRSSSMPPPHALAGFWAEALHEEDEEINAFVHGLVEPGRVPEEYTVDIGGKRRWR